MLKTWWKSLATAVLKIRKKLNIVHSNQHHIFCTITQNCLIFNYSFNSPPLSLIVCFHFWNFFNGLKFLIVICIPPYFSLMLLSAISYFYSNNSGCCCCCYGFKLRSKSVKICWKSQGIILIHTYILKNSQTNVYSVASSAQQECESMHTYHANDTFKLQYSYSHTHIIHSNTQT